MQRPASRPLSGASGTPRRAGLDGRRLSASPLSQTARLPFAGLFFAWLTYLVTLTQPWLASPAFGPTLVLQAVLAGLPLLCVAVLLARRRLPGPTRLDAPLAALVVVYLAAALQSDYARESLDTMALVLCAVATFYVAADHLEPRLAARGLVLAGAAAAGYALFDIGGKHAGWLDLVRDVEDGASLLRLPPTLPRVTEVGDHANLLAMALNLALPFAVALALGPRDGPSRLSDLAERTLAAVMALLLGLALLFTVSRSAWAGTAAALLLLLGLAAAGRRGAPRPPSLRRLLPLTVALGALAVLAAAVLLGRWDSRPQWLFRASLSPREDAVTTGIDIFRDRPWLGVGPNAYAFYYPTYSGAYPIENIHAHNGYVQALDDVGLIGGGVVGVLGLSLVAALAAAWTSGSAGQRALTAAAAAALLSLAVHAFADTPNISKTALLPLAVVAAVAVRLAPPPAPRPGAALRALPRLVVLAAPLVAAAAWASAGPGHSAYDASLRRLNDGDFAAAAAEAARAADRDPDFGAYGLHAGALAAIDYLVARDRGRADPAALDAAIAALRKGIETERRSASGHANLALTLLLKGGAALEEEATALARLAMRLAPGDGVIAGLAGTVFERTGRLDEALRAYAIAVTHDAALLQSPFWQTTPFRASVRQEVADATFLTACQKGRIAALFPAYAADFEGLERDCRSTVAAAPGDARARSDLAVLLSVLGRDSEALAEARRAVDRSGDNAYARTALGVVLARRGDLQAARKELLLGTYLGDPDAALLLYYTYRRPATLAVPAIALPSAGEPAPAEVRERAAAAFPTSSPMAFSGGVQNYLQGILYYRIRFHRESPTTVLVPGEWIGLASPRSLLLEQLAAGP
jgi:O-antigen ligase/Flp pilus assembly protein TadD